LKTLFTQELIGLSKAETSARKRMRLLAVAHFMEGANRSKISRILKVNCRSVKTWVENYLSQEFDRLNIKMQKGCVCYLSSVQQRKSLANIV
jgi:transposase